MAQDTAQKSFYGWWIVALAFLTFGISVGIPYYGMPFFYDYYEKTFGWSRKDITLGFPIAATLTLWVGPLLVHRFSPRKLLIAGTGLTGLAFVGFGTMGSSIYVYWSFWVLYTVGYIFSGPIVHQVIVSQWFRTNRGKAMAVVYLGVGVFAAISQKLIAKPLTENFGFQQALVVIGCLMLLVWPLAYFGIKDKPAELGQFPDGAAQAASDQKVAPKSFRYLLGQRSFWLLLVGSCCSIGAIGSVNQHMKFIFKEQGFSTQALLNETSANALFIISLSSVAGRMVMGYMADRFQKKVVMLITYFIVAGTIPLLLLVRPEQEFSVYLFSILFGFGMGADYMMIPLMAADRFGVNSLFRAMAIILPTDTIGQTWFPYGVAWLRENYGDYGVALNVVFVMAAIGAIAIALLPGHKKENEVLPIQDAQRA
ncbi:MFS transporter [Bryobacter aggregatus]|uniref:MFS transporter n=1 Tax=Bryobacter aggregatus TaxID=360054 RepID=UPI0004E28840|nr:MFS transporter [Bryobacter aggregatus]